MAENDKALYRLTGAKGAGEIVDQVVISGTASEPRVILKLHGEMPMTESEAERVRREHGVVLRKIGDYEPDDSSPGQSSAKPKGGGDK